MGSSDLKIIRVDCNKFTLHFFGDLIDTVPVELSGRGSGQ